MIDWTVELLHPTDPHAGSSFALSVWGRQQVGFIERAGDPARTRLAAGWVSKASTFRNLHPPSARASVAHCVRERAIVGRVSRDRGLQPFRWSGFDDQGVVLGNDSGEARAHAGETSGGLAAVDACVWDADGAVRIVHSEVAGGIHGQSVVNGMFEGHQVGTVSTMSGARAYLWNADLGSAVNLHPSGIAFASLTSECNDIHGEHQVGHFAHRACMWHGRPEERVDLHPAGADHSVATGIYDGTQVGHFFTGNGWQACAWTGTAASVMNLHSVLPAGFSMSQAHGVWKYPEGPIVVAGWGYNAGAERFEALLWKGRVTSAPSSPPLLGKRAVR